MTAAFTTVCSHCGHSMKLSNRGLIGKRAPCPGCREPFVITEEVLAADVYEDDVEYSEVKGRESRERRQPPRRAEARPTRPQSRGRARPAKSKPKRDFYDFDDPGDEFAEDNGDEYDDFDQPRRPTRKGGKSKAKKSGKKGRKQGGGWVKPTLLIGGGIAGVALLGLGVWFLFGLFGGKKLDYAYIHEDATSVKFVRYSRVWDSKIVQEALGGDSASKVKKMKEDWGLEPTEIESLTEATGGGKTIRVVRTTVDMDRDKILGHASGHEKAEHDGQTYHRKGSWAIWFPDDRTAISGNESGIKSAIDSDGKSADWSKLSFVDRKQDFIDIVVNVEGRSVRSNGFALGGLGGDLGKVEASAQGMTLGSTISMKGQTKFTDSDDAVKVKQEADSKLEDLDKEIEKMKSGPLSNAMTAEQKAAMEKTMRSFRFSRSGDVVTVTMTVYPVDGKAFGMGLGANRATSMLDNVGRTLFGISASSSSSFNLNPRRPARPNAGTNAGGPKRMWRVEFQIRSFRGGGDRRAAVETALRSVRNGTFDFSRLEVADDRIVVYAENRGGFFSTASLRSALLRAGFSVGRTSMRTVTE